MPQQILNTIYLFCTINGRDYSCSFKRNGKLLQSFKEPSLPSVIDLVIMIFFFPMTIKHRIQPVTGRNEVKNKNIVGRQYDEKKETRRFIWTRKLGLVSYSFVFGWLTWVTKRRFQRKLSLPLEQLKELPLLCWNGYFSAICESWDFCFL